MFCTRSVLSRTPFSLNLSAKSVWLRSGRACLVLGLGPEQRVIIGGTWTFLATEQITGNGRSSVKPLVFPFSVYLSLAVNAQCPPPPPSVVNIQRVGYNKWLTGGKVCQQRARWPTTEYPRPRLLKKLCSRHGAALSIAQLLNPRRHLHNQRTVPLVGGVFFNQPVEAASGKVVYQPFKLLISQGLPVVV
jgi:hypothetical protein